MWLFGGATVYKNFFDQKKHVMEFRMAAIEQLFHVDRHKLIQLAMLVGSDYTTGITGIGAVTGMEILAQFPGTAATTAGQVSEVGVSEHQAMVSGLRRFKEWWAGGQGRGGAATGVLRNKLKNISIGEGFPSQAVVEAYLYPCVDASTAEFTWGSLDVETIREFAKRNFGWTRARTDDLLLPVVKKWEEKTVQRSIRNYFANTGGKGGSPGKDLKMSKRVQRAVMRMGGQESEEKEGSEKKKKERQPRKKKATAGSVVKEVSGDSDCQVVGVVDEGVPGTSGVNTENKVARKRKQEGENVNIDKQSSRPKRALAASKKTVNIPDANPAIPQRDRTKKMEEERLKKAAEIFRGKKGG